MNILYLFFKSKIKFYYIIFFISIFLFSNASSQIKDPYKIKSPLKKCEGENFLKWDNCFAEIQFPKSSYSGEWKNGKFHGNGSYKDNNGLLYKGKFHENIFKDEKGLIYYTDNSVYEGETLEKPNGFGKIIKENGETYIGEFKNGSKIGNYSLVTSEGKYEAEWTSDGLNFGKFTQNENLKYFGYFDHEYQFSKWGALEKKGNFYYEGEFLSGMFQGEGKIIFDNGDIYEGNFHQGKFHGEGKLKYSNGNFDEGIWINGKKLN